MRSKGHAGTTRGVQCVGSPGAVRSVPCRPGQLGVVVSRCRGHGECHRGPSFLRLSVVAYGTVTLGTLALSM